MTLRATIATVVTLTGLFAGTAAMAEAGQPVPWGIGFQDSVTEIMTRTNSMHFGLMVVITLITLFVTALLAYVWHKFRAEKNPTADRFTHNTVVEVVWTVVPVLILIGIAIPSLRLLYFQETIPPADITVKATGYQWYWGYTYDINGEEVAFDSVMLSDEEAEAAGKPRLLGVDVPMVVPVNKVVRMQLTGADVIHAWTIPSFGVKMDAIPGRLNELWFKAEQEGVYYGQCSELCGSAHAYMPIEVHVVSDEEYAAWTETAYEEYAVRPVAAKTTVAALN